MSTEDKEILDLLQDQKQRGLIKLFDRYFKPLVLLADLYLKNEYSAEDIVQEQFIKFWDKKLYQQMKSHTSLKNYLFTMVKNASLNHIRKKDILLESSELFEIGENITQDLTEEGIERIKNTIANLPEQTRKVVECILVQDMKYQEASDELGISINTVKTHLKRGVLKLKTELKDQKDLLFLFLFNKVNS